MEGKRQKRLKRRTGRHEMSGTAQLMVGHEMALPLIMIVCAGKTDRKERERQQ